MNFCVFLSASCRVLARSIRPDFKNEKQFKKNVLSLLDPLIRVAASPGARLGAEFLLY